MPASASTHGTNTAGDPPGQPVVFLALCFFLSPGRRSQRRLVPSSVAARLLHAAQLLLARPRCRAGNSGRESLCHAHRVHTSAPTGGRGEYAARHGDSEGDMVLPTRSGWSRRRRSGLSGRKASRCACHTEARSHGLSGRQMQLQQGAEPVPVPASRTTRALRCLYRADDASCRVAGAVALVCAGDACVCDTCTCAPWARFEPRRALLTTAFWLRAKLGLLNASRVYIMFAYASTL